MGVDSSRRRSAPDLADELWTVAHLVRYLPWGRSTVYELIRTPGFPAGRWLPGPRGHRRAWRACEVRAWVEAALGGAEAAVPGQRAPGAGGGPESGRRRG